MIAMKRSNCNLESIVILISEALEIEL